jgi:outer membrane protein TolC
MAQLEQVALEMDSQSVKAERFPEVNVTVTGVLYDLSNNPLNEYELYGGLSMNLPLFDGGERDAKIEGIEVQKTIKRSTLKKALSDLQANWDQTEVELKKLESQSLENQARLESIIDRLEELKIRARTIESGLIEVTQTELQRRSVARELVLTQLTRAVLQTRKAELSGRLMEMIRVEPTIQ